MHMVCSKPSLIKLLLHRRNYKNTIFSTLRSLILTQSTPLSVLGDIFDILNSVIDDVLINQVLLYFVVLYALCVVAISVI